ncbi:hypothetical protein FM107_12400 [Sphingobacterium sp. JB170]|nr:hypothetical protein FM107_12400 [Sphingobacterium sp. JB170]
MSLKVLRNIIDEHHFSTAFGQLLKKNANDNSAEPALVLIN